MVTYPLKFLSVPKERIWGGNKLKDLFGMASEVPIGEFWTLSAHPKGASVVVNGEFAGKTLAEVTKYYPEDYLGDSPQDRFPLLIKFLEATEDLSVQIHPDDEYAKANEGDFGKAEAWYILECKADGRVIYGHRFTSREEYLLAAIENRTIDYLCYKPIQKEQLLFVPSQTIHALLAGTIVIEVQQTSDVTYRIYDWNRLDRTGKQRELHIEKAADVLKYGEENVCAGASVVPVQLVKTESVDHVRFVNCPQFSIEKISIQKGAYHLELGKKGNPDILIIAAGEGILPYDGPNNSLDLKFGDTVLVPSSLHSYFIRSDSEIVILRAFY
jgi:mannose-6-phosphate isomerase